MFRYLIILLLLTAGMPLFAQPSALLTTPLYDSTFTSLPGEYRVAAGLRGKSLADLVADGVISRTDMAGLALPLGVHNREGEVDFTLGMIDMYHAKGRFVQSREQSLSGAVLAQAMQTLTALKTEPRPTTLADYRQQIITPALARIQRVHDQVAPLYSPERRQFMDIVMGQLSPNALLGYNIQEMLPPDVGDYRAWVNPLFKAYFFDRLLQEAGMAFVAGFPSRYDALLSYGPFQLTQIALDDIHANSRLPEGLFPYRDMSELGSLQAQAEAAAFFAYNNWERLSIFMQTYGGLTNFNAYFAPSQMTDARQRELRIFIAGVTACMHHQPIPTWNVVQSYVKAHADLGQMHVALFSYALEADVLSRRATVAQLRKYYRSAAEAYLIMKVYQTLMYE